MFGVPLKLNKDDDTKKQKIKQINKKTNKKYSNIKCQYQIYDINPSRSNPGRREKN